MNGAGAKAVPRNVRFVLMPTGIGTPKGLIWRSRGQGHASCARRPRIASLPRLPTLRGSNGSAPCEWGVEAVREPPLPSMIRFGKFHLWLLTVFPLRGTRQRSNLFESHGQTSGLPS